MVTEALEVELHQFHLLVHAELSLHLIHHLEGLRYRPLSLSAPNVQKGKFFMERERNVELRFRSSFLCLFSFFLLLELGCGGPSSGVGKQTSLRVDLIPGFIYGPYDLCSRISDLFIDSFGHLLGDCSVWIHCILYFLSSLIHCSYYLVQLRGVYSEEVGGEV